MLLLTLTPSYKMPITPVWELLSFDTAAHAGVFVVLAGLSWFSLRRQRRWPRVARRVGRVVLVGSILFGGLIEVLQHTMALGRHGEWTDLISDAIGAALAVGIATAVARRQSRRARSLASVCWLGLAAASAGLSGVPTTARAQDLSRARRTIAKLASPGLHGRGYVKEGEQKAAAYLRKRFVELKLEPLAPDFTQPFTLNVNTFPGKLELDVIPFGPLRRMPNTAHLQPGRDFIAAPNSAKGKLDWGSRLVRLDTLAFTDSLVRTRAVAQLNKLPGAVLLTTRDENRLANLPALRQAVESAAARITLVPKLTAAIASEQTTQVRLLALPTAAAWPVATTVPMLMKGVHIRVNAELQSGYQTQNVAAVIRGTTQPDSFLVVSAHYDHLGRMGRKTYFPGANDNASGVALLLELAAHYARPENRPAYSVVFLLFGAEEAGLVGSTYFVAHPLVPLQRIKFLVNLDLLGTGEEGATVVNGKVYAAAYQRLLALNDTHRYLPALGARGRAANSDHFPFSEAGVPAFFLYTRGGSTAYHDVQDRPEALSLAGFAGAFGLVRDFLNEPGRRQVTGTKKPLQGLQRLLITITLE
ncbi:M28 family peptidase [Hymenobacter humi]|uniref:M28 family peptidase n=1 Tax=Hymenobacter humi TaxID=1411620 RepID=A0ABW2U222_9BACT